MGAQAHPGPPARGPPDRPVRPPALGPPHRAVRPPALGPEPHRAAGRAEGGQAPPPAAEVDARAGAFDALDALGVDALGPQAVDALGVDAVDAQAGAAAAQVAADG